VLRNPSSTPAWQRHSFFHEHETFFHAFPARNRAGCGHFISQPLPVQFFA
jgi:hypothetical protein